MAISIFYDTETQGSWVGPGPLDRSKMTPEMREFSKNWIELPDYLFHSHKDA